MKAKVVKLNPQAKIPTQESQGAAGYDLYACIPSSVEIKPGETVKIGTGLSIEFENNYAGFLFARSGLATKRGLRPANCVGVCDSDYRGEYIVALYNDSDRLQTVNPGDRIAQLVVMPVLHTIFEEVENLSDTARGSGGFGSTGN